MVDKLSLDVGPGTAIVYNPDTGEVDIQNDILAGYYLECIRRQVAGEEDSPIPYRPVIISIAG